MNKNFWKDLAAKGPIVALAPMDGYTDGPYRLTVRKTAPSTVVFSEFYSADGLVRSKHLAQEVLPHDEIERPVVFQIFGKDPEMFREAAKMIEAYGATGVDINMGCPAKKVVKSGHGSSLMINRDTAFRIVEEMAKAVKIPVSVKTRLGWADDSLLVEFCQGLQNAGADLITVHGRTYQQAFNGKADFTGIYELKKHLSIPVIANGDITDYDDGISKLGNLDGFMIGRASFGNPWAFLPGKYRPTLREILATMGGHAELLIEKKGRKGALEARKHLVEYLHGFPGVKTYRTRLVSVENLEDIRTILSDISAEWPDLLDKIPDGSASPRKFADIENCPVD